MLAADLTTSHFDISQSFLLTGPPARLIFEYRRKVVRLATMQTKQVIDALGALAHDTRLQVYRMLVQQGPAGIPAGLIAERLGIPPSSLTFHLQQLLHAGLATQRRVSRQIIYAADYAAMNGLMTYLTENCCGGAAVCAPACNPAPSMKGAPDETPARARRRR